MKTKLLALAMATCLAFLVGCQSGNQNTSAPANSSSTKSSIVSSQDSPSLSDNDKGEVESIVKALSGSLMLSTSWSNISGEDYKYDLSLTTFYCIMNPNSPAEIPAADYEAFMQKYFTVTVDALHEMSDYDKAKNTYTVSPDISIDRAVTQSAEVLKIDSIELQSDGIVKVMYRSIWGKMASSGDGSDTAFAGNILLEKKNDGYKVKSVEVTEDNADKDLYNNDVEEPIVFVPKPGDDAFYQQVVAAKKDITTLVSEMITLYKAGTHPDNPNHYDAYPANYPPVVELADVQTSNDFAVRFAGNPDAMGSVYLAVPIGDSGMYELQLLVDKYTDEEKGGTEWKWGVTGASFETVSDLQWHQQDIDLYKNTSK